MQTDNHTKITTVEQDNSRLLREIHSMSSEAKNRLAVVEATLQNQDSIIKFHTKVLWTMIVSVLGALWWGVMQLFHLKS